MALTIPAAFPTASEVKAAAQAVKTSAGTFPSDSDEVVTAARRWAYGEILRRLVKQGYSMAQVNAWDLLWEFGRDLCLWKLWKERIVSVQSDYEATDHVLHWDRREELDEVAVTTDGEVVTPDGGIGAGVGYGDMTFGSDAIFTLETEW